MNPSDMHRLISNLDYFAENTDNIPELLTHLIAKSVLTVTDCENIRSKPSRLEKCIEISFRLVRCGQPLAFTKLIECLQATDNNFVADKLLENNIENIPINYINTITLTNLTLDIQCPTSKFIGRLTDIHNLHIQLYYTPKCIGSNYSFVNIIGMGGIGKTEIVKKYIEIFGQKIYENNLIWMDATNFQSLSTGFKNLANILVLQSKSHEQQNIRSIIEIIYCHLSQTKVLFIFDNFNKNGWTNHNNNNNGQQSHTTTSIQDFFPNFLNNLNKYFIITSRESSGINENIQTISLAPFTKEESCNFLKKSLKHECNNEQQLEELADKLNHHPKALINATSFILSKGPDFSILKYLEIYKKKLDEVICLLNSGPSPSSSFIIENFTKIPWHFTNLLDYEIINEYNFEEFIRGAINALINILGPYHIDIFHLKQLASLIFQNLNKFIEALQLVKENYIQHGLSNHIILSTNEIINIKIQLGDLSYKTGEYNSAMGYYKDVYHWYKNKLGEENRITLQIYNSIVKVLLEQKIFNEGITTFEQIHKVRIRCFGDKDKETIDFLYEFGDILLRLKQYTKAFEIFKNVYELQQGYYQGVLHKDIYFTQYGIAACLLLLKRHDESFEFIDLALNTAQTLQLNDQPRMSSLQKWQRLYKNPFTRFMVTTMDTFFT